MANDKQREAKLKRAIAKSERRVGGILRNARRSINGAVAGYAKLPGFSKNPATRNRLYRELAKEYEALNSEINKWVDSEVRVTSKNWFNYARQDLQVKGTFGAFSAKYVDDIIAQINPASVKGAVAMNAQIGGMQTADIRALRAAVSTTMAEGAVEGLTYPQLAARMESKVINAVGGFNFVDKAGRKWTADNYFGMLNRTMHANAARMTYINEATNELGYDLYQIIGGVTGSSMDNPADPCDAWVGRLISMTGKTKGYPTYDDAVSAGVFHPNCVHDVRALLPSEIPAAKAREKANRKKEEALGDE